MPERQKSGKGMQISFSTWLKLFIFIIGLVLGIGAQHYYIEPFLSNTFGEQLVQCVSEKQLLNEEINNCYVERDACRENCPTTQQ